jgi:hypothetical protein
MVRAWAEIAEAILQNGDLSGDREVALPWQQINFGRVSTLAAAGADGPMHDRKEL